MGGILRVLFIALATAKPESGRRCAVNIDYKCCRWLSVQVNLMNVAECNGENEIIENLALQRENLRLLAKVSRMEMTLKSYQSFG